MGVPAYMLGRPLAVFAYKNYKGITTKRRVIPDRVVYLDDPGYGYKPGFFLVAWDIRKDAFRQFALDPERMFPATNMETGEREAYSTHGLNIVLQVAKWANTSNLS